MDAPLPDLTGKSILVTGSTDGIGRETARQLTQLGARLLVHGRSKERVEQTVIDLAGEASAEVLGFVADLSSLGEVRSLAAEVLQAAPRLDVLINNAGVYQEKRVLTADGYETTFAVNHLAPFLLTNLLLDRLRATAPARVITVASVAHRAAWVDWRNLQAERHYDGYDAYALSKLCNVLFTYELAERLAGSGVTANCLHPGLVATKLLRAGFPRARGSSPKEGARTSVYLASSPEVEDVSGHYFVKGRQEMSAPQTYDRRAQRRLWEVSAGLAGLTEG